MTADPNPRGDEAFVFPASCSQQRLWFLDHLQPGSAAYNLPRAVRLEGPLDAAALERALAEVVARHEALRTTFASEDGVAVQVVAVPSAAAVRLPVEDLTSWPELEREAALAHTLAATASAPFDLDKGPLLRARLVRLRADLHVFIVAASHIVADGVSIALLYKELSALYAAFVAGQPSPLPPVTTQFADYALVERERLASGQLEGHLAYWREQLAGELPATEVPPDRARPAAPSRRGGLHHARLATREGALALAALCREERTTPFSALLAAFALLLQRHTGHDDVLVGSPFGNRSRAEGEGPAGPRFHKWLLSIGFYAATVVLRVSLAGDPTFRELVRRAREVIAGAGAHVDLPFERLVEALRPARDASSNPFFQIMLSYLAAPDRALTMPGVKVTPVDASHGGSMFDLLVQLEDAEDGLEGYFTYSAELYDEETIARFAANFAHVVAAAVAAPDAAVSRLAVPAEAERGRVLVEWNETAAPVTPACVHLEVERQAARTPERIAVRTGPRALSYAELDGRANRLARRLQELGVGPDGLVGICLPRGPDLVVAALATLKAGGAYLPLDPAYPARRLAQMLEDSRAGVVVTTSSLAGGLPLGSARAVCLDADAEAFAPEDGAAPVCAARPENLAYVIYTSGSTGAPKGVMVEHRQVSSFFAAMDRVLGRPPRAEPPVWLAATSLSFDISVLELFWTLTRGFTVVVEAQDDVDKAGAFAETVAAHGVTHFQCTPSMATLLVADEASRAALGALEVMLVGGEALSPALAREIVGNLRGDLFNMYGPTETTVWSTAWRVDREAFARSTPPPVSIGRPIANTTVYVLDGRREPVPIGVAGEIHIGGAGVTRGYFGRPELTDERFVANPFGAGRLYRTGDLGRHRADGTIEFLGRVDHQVKIRGHRIELGEIEQALREISGAREIVVVARPEPSGQANAARLVAYLAGAAAAPPAAELRKSLRARLPEPMVPSAFVVLDALPHTPNGKIDRNALPAPEDAAPEAGSGDSFVAPRTPTEQVVAEIWREVLGVPRVSIYDNFFDLGGHSLLSPRVVHHIETRLKKRLNVSELILQNLSQLAARCDQAPEVDAPRARRVLGALKRIIAR
jgi:amino acid adenylation domain-containing protein